MATSNKKAPGFLLARVSLYLAGAATASLGVVGWFDPRPDVASVAFMAAAALSALVVPFNIEVVGRARASALCLIPCLVFGMVNAYSVHHAVEKLVEGPRIEQHDAEHTGEAAAYAAARQAVLDHKPFALSPDMPKGRVEMQQTSWDKAHAALVKVRDEAKADLDAVPAYVPMVDTVVLWVIAGLLDFSIAAGLCGIAMVRSRIEARLAAERAKARKVQKKPAREIKPADYLSKAEQAELRKAPHLTVVR